MAKVGEGDPRWIVSDRDDGKNVGAWHWEEKDLTKQAQDALKALFAGRNLVQNPPTLVLKIKEVSEINGEVTVAQRKGKIFCYFELRCTMQWEGTADSSNVSGKLTLAEVDHDNFRSDFDIGVTAKERDSFHATAEAWLQKEGRAIVRREIAQYFNKLFEENNVGTFIRGQPQPTSAPNAAASGGPAKKPAPPARPDNASLTSYALRMRWHAPIEELFKALIDEQQASMYMRAPAKIDPRPSGLFSLLGGSIAGYYVDVTFPTKLTMQWRLASWRSQVHSSVVIVLVKEEPGVTLIDFAQQGIPEGEVECVRRGWMDSVFDPLRKMVGWRMDLL